jgi:tripeptidyl-peptidase-1
LYATCIALLVSTLAIASCATDAHAPDPIFVALQPHNVDALRAALDAVSDPASPRYRQFWSREDAAKITAPPQHDIQAALTWAARCGASCVPSGGGAALRCTANKAAKRDKIIQCLRDTPDALRTVVAFVEAEGPRRQRKGKRSGPTGAVDPGWVCRDTLVRLYDIPEAATGAGSSVCPVEFLSGNGFSQSGLSQLQNATDVPAQTVPPERIIGVSDSPDDGESDLDMSMANAAAPGADLWYWGGDHWMFGWAVAALERDNDALPHVFSMSWGWAEWAQCSVPQNGCPGNITAQTYIERTDVEFMRLGLRGRTLVAASGDAGAPGRTAEGCGGINPAYPAASPYVTSVGATYVVAASGHKTAEQDSPFCRHHTCANGTDERITNFAQTQWTSGGGFAIYETARAWQEPVVLEYLESAPHLPPASTFNTYGRGYPDLAMNGHNCATGSSDGISPEDGTSCSAPTWAGVVTLLVEAAGGLLGWMNPLLYTVAGEAPSTFRDHTAGNNSCTEQACCGGDYGFVATEGWDPVYGLGTPNVRALIAAVRKHTARSA